jgi:hypothetical protein
MVILIYLNILLRFLINLFRIVFIRGKISHYDISSDNENIDSESTLTNSFISGEDDVTINDITDMKHTIEQLKRAVRGEHIDQKE